VVIIVGITAEVVVFVVSWWEKNWKYKFWFSGRGGGDRGGGSYRGSRGNSYRGANRGTEDSSNYWAY
jgi:hypothetical protein